MALKNILNTMKGDNYVVNRLDRFLLNLDDKDADRRWDINSPSMSSQCCRAIYYSRTETERDAFAVDSRTRRVFDNGTHVHMRLEDYLLEAGIACLNEIPVVDLALKIMGHADLLFNLPRGEKAVGELKSINDMGFNALKDAKPEHKQQALCYMYCLENRRIYLRNNYKSKLKFKKYLASKKYKNLVYSLYDYFEDGSKFTREEKLKYKLEQYRKLDEILWNTKKSIKKMIFIYENKNTQDLKEFTVPWDDGAVKEMKEKFTKINKYVSNYYAELNGRDLDALEMSQIRNKYLPKREGTSKSCSTCRWCNFKESCFIV